MPEVRFYDSSRAYLFTRYVTDLLPVYCILDTPNPALFHSDSSEAMRPENNVHVRRFSLEYSLEINPTEGSTFTVTRVPEYREIKTSSQTFKQYRITQRRLV